MQGSSRQECFHATPATARRVTDKAVDGKKGLVPGFPGGLEMPCTRRGNGPFVRSVD